MITQTRRERPDSSSYTTTSSPRRWSRWALLLLLTALAAFFIVPFYYDVDPSKARVPLPPGQPFKYPILIAHIITGSIAVIALLAQAFPPVRRKGARIHRRIGFIYCYLGVFPSVVFALILLTMVSGPGHMGRIALEIGWAVFTVGAVMAIRRGNVRLHRRLMAYSAALTLDAFTTRFLQLLLFVTFGTNINLVLFLNLVAWGWLLNLVVAHVWISRVERRLTRSPREQLKTAPASRRNRRLLLLATVLALAFVLLAVPPYLRFDPTLSKVPINDLVPLHFGLLVAHILTGTVALLSGVAQLWTLRSRKFSLHRILGRIYLFAGMAPTALLALLVALPGLGSTQSDSVSESTAMALRGIGLFGAAAWACLALLTTIVGYVHARRREWDEHRRHMLRSVALAFGPIAGRLWFFILTPLGVSAPIAATVGGFLLGWMSTLVGVELWLRREQKRKSMAAADEAPPVSLHRKQAA